MNDEVKKVVEDAVKKALEVLATDTNSPPATGDWKKVLYDVGKVAFTAFSTLALAYLGMKLGIQLPQ